MKSVFFDLDGTLTDPREGITRSIAHAMERMGVAPPPLAELEFAIGPPLRPTLGKLIGDESPGAIEQALAHYRERFGDVGLFENAVYDGIVETLSALTASGATLVVATSKPRVYAERIVCHFGLDRHFAEVHGCELDGTREDKRDLLAHLIPHHGFDVRHSAMIGDRGVDMIAARHHGVHALGALWGFGSREELTAAGAHSFAETPTGILAALR
ncbi:MAG: HAD hydrolase-like protein [Usitatibacter sp.]